MQDSIDRISASVRGSKMLRLLAVGALALLLQIPILMIRGLVSERQTRRLEAVTEVSAKWGNTQVDRRSGPGGSLRPAHRRAVVGRRAHQPGRVALGDLPAGPSERARHHRLRPSAGAGSSRSRSTHSTRCSKASSPVPTSPSSASSRSSWRGTAPTCRSASPTRAPSSARPRCAGTARKRGSCRGTAASPTPAAPGFTPPCGWPRRPSATRSRCRSPSTAASGSTSRRSARTRRSRSSPTTAIRASRATGSPTERTVATGSILGAAGRSRRWAGTIPRPGTTRRRCVTLSTTRASASSWSIRWTTIEWRSAAGSTPDSSSCSRSRRCGWWRSWRASGCIRSST